MARAALMLIVKLALTSAVVFILWQGSAPGLGTFWTGGVEQLWLGWIKAVLRGMHSLLGLESSAYNLAWQMARGYFLSVIPFTVLMIVAGPLTRVRRLTRGLLGLIILGVWQCLTPLILYLLLSCYGQGRTFFVGIFPVFMFSYSLPFILWLLFSRDRIEKWFTHHWLPSALRRNRAD